MPRSEPGCSTGLSATSTAPSVAGWCGRRPAISRKTVDLPQPEGPRIAMNSPFPGRSGTEKVTSRMIVTFPNCLVTPRNSTTLGSASINRPLILGGPMREQAPLEPEEHAIDSVRERADDEEDQDDVLRQPAPLARHQQIAQPVLRVDQFRQHDVAEGEAEEMPQAVVDVRQGERDEHLAD